MNLVFVIFGLLAVGALILNRIAWSHDKTRYTDALGLAFMLLCMWAGSNVLVAVWGVPAGLRAYPVMDLAAGLLTLFAWGSDRRNWKVALAFTFVLDCVCHLSFWMTGGHAFTEYALSLNALFVLQCLVVGWPGGLHVASAVMRRLRLHPSWHGVVGR